MGGLGNLSESSLPLGRGIDREKVLFPFKHSAGFAKVGFILEYIIK